MTLPMRGGPPHMVRWTSIAGVLAADAAVGHHASAFTPGAASPRALLLPAVHDGLAHGGETAANRFPAAAAQEDKEKRVGVPADGVARGSGQRRQQQRAHGGSGAARAGGRADAAPATKSASAPEAQRWAFVTGSIVHSSPAVSPDGASIFVGSGDNKVYALNAATGVQRWAFATPCSTNA